jgi:cell division protein FtsI (penicillin-binding protein 3)
MTGPRLANRRIRLLLAVFAVAFAGMLGRAVWLQAVQAGTLSRLGTEQHDTSVTLPAGRGAILDREGLQLAIGRDATTVFANPRQIADPKAAALAAGKDLGLDPEELYSKLADRSRGFVYIARKTDPERARTLKERGITGIFFTSEERRTYPQGRIASQVLGYAGLDNKGLAGLELQLDRPLAGRAGHERYVRDPSGRSIEVVESRPALDGDDVTLTLDHTIQSYAESVLQRTVMNWGAKAGSAIVLDPRNGEILAMATVPGFDANRYGFVPRDVQRNRAVTDTYEPGSTFKVVTIAAALSTRVVAPSTSFVLPYEIEVADRRIHDSHERGTERMTVAQILSRSSNVGTVTVAEMLGQNRLARWIDRFGFGRKTRVDFPGETRGIVLPVEKWSGSTIGNVPIGQGIAVTPIQMAAAYGAIANHGVWVRPHLVRHVGSRRVGAGERRRIISPVVSSQVMAMMQDVVNEAGGTGALARLEGYSVAGKTGTASKPERGGYSDSRYVASFVGVVPASAPRLVVLVSVDEPKGAIWGGVVAAPAFQEIARYALQYLEIPPDDVSRVAGSQTSGQPGP